MDMVSGVNRDMDTNMDARTTNTNTNADADARTASTNADMDARFMALALEEARRAVPVPTAYCVGAVLVDAATGRVRATGFSRELPGNTHAEECCLLKIAEQDAGQAVDVAACTMYTTMEPCALRLSGKMPCAARLIAAGVGRVVVGIREPPDFVADCNGVEQLRAAGVRVDVCDRYADECLAVSRQKAGDDSNSNNATPAPS